MATKLEMAPMKNVTWHKPAEATLPRQYNSLLEGEFLVLGSQYMSEDFQTPCNLMKSSNK